MPALDLTGVGGWFGAQNALRDIVAQTAARGAQERNQIESMMQLALKDRAQQVSEGDLDLRLRTYDEAAPIREADLARVGATTGLTRAQTANLEGEPMRDFTRERQAQSDRVALAILQDQLGGKRDLATQTWHSGENELDRKNRLQLERQQSGSAFRRPMLFQGLDGSPYFIDPVSGQGRTATDASGQPLLGKATMGQQDAKKYYDRNKIALDAMDEYEWKLTPEDIAIITVKPMVKTPLGTSIANSALTQNGKMYATALAQFMESYLRDDSGKLITPEEYANGARMYGRTLDESSPDEPISQFKRKGRHTINQGLLTTSGPYRAQTLQQEQQGGDRLAPPPAAEPITGEWVRNPQTNRLERVNRR